VLLLVCAAALSNKCDNSRRGPTKNIQPEEEQRIRSQLKAENTNKGPLKRDVEGNFVVYSFSEVQLFFGVGAENKFVQPISNKTTSSMFHKSIFSRTSSQE